MVSPQPLKTAMRDNDSDEEPIPPPVVKRVWINPSTPSVDNTDNRYSSSGRSHEPAKDGGLPSHSSKDLNSGMSEDSTLDDKVVVKKFQSVTALMPESYWDSSNSRSGGVNSFSSQDHNMQNYQKIDSTLPASDNSSSVHSLSESTSRLPVTFQIKLPGSHSRNSKPPLQLSSNSLSSEKLSLVRVQSPTSVPLSSNSKSVPSPVIKTIYSNSQSLPGLKSTMSSAVVHRQKEKSKNILERKMDLLRTSSPVTPTEDAGNVSSHIITPMDTKELLNKHQKKYPTLEVKLTVKIS